MMYKSTISTNISFDTKEELFAYQQGRADVINAIQTELDLLNASDMNNVNLYSFACKVMQIIVELKAGD